MVVTLYIFLNDYDIGKKYDFAQWLLFVGKSEVQFSLLIKFLSFFVHLQSSDLRLCFKDTSSV